MSSGRNVYLSQFLTILNFLFISHTLGRAPMYKEEITGLEDYNNFKNVQKFFGIGLGPVQTSAENIGAGEEKKHVKHDYYGYGYENDNHQHDEDYNEHDKTTTDVKSTTKELDNTTAMTIVSNAVNTKTQSGLVVNNIASNLRNPGNPTPFARQPYANNPGRFENNPNGQYQVQPRYGNRNNFQGNNNPGAFGSRQTRPYRDMYPQRIYQTPPQSMNHGFYKPSTPYNYGPNWDYKNGLYGPRQNRVKNPGNYQPLPGLGRGSFKEVAIEGDHFQLKEIKNPEDIKKLMDQINIDPVFVEPYVKQNDSHPKKIENGVIFNKVTSVKDVKESMLLNALKKTSKADLRESLMKSEKNTSHHLPTNSTHNNRHHHRKRRKKILRMQSQATTGAQYHNVKYQTYPQNRFPQMQNIINPHQNLNSRNWNTWTQKIEPQNQNLNVLKVGTNPQYPLKPKLEFYNQYLVPQNPQPRYLNPSQLNQNPRDKTQQNENPKPQYFLPNAPYPPAPNFDPNKKPPGPQYPQIARQNPNPQYTESNYQYPLDQKPYPIGRGSIPKNQYPNPQNHISQDTTQSQNSPPSPPYSSSPSFNPYNQASTNPQEANKNSSPQYQPVTPQNQGSAAVPSGPPNLLSNPNGQAPVLQNQSAVPQNQNFPHYSSSNSQYLREQETNLNQSTVPQTPTQQNQPVTTFQNFPQNNTPSSQFPTDQKPVPNVQDVPIPENPQSGVQNTSSQNQNILPQQSQASTPPYPQYPTEQKPDPNPHQSSLSPTQPTQSLIPQNWPAENQSIYSQNPGPNPQSPETQTTNLQNQTPALQSPGAQTQTTQESTTTLEPVNFDYNAYDDIPGWFEGQFPALSTIATTTPPPTTTESTINEPNENYTTTTVSDWIPRPEIIANAKKTMITYQMGFFTGFIDALFNLLREVSSEDYSIMMAIKEVVDKLDAEGKLQDMGRPAVPALHSLISIMIGWGPNEVRQQLGMLSSMIRARKEVLTEDILGLVNMMDSSYTMEEGEILLQSLEDVYNYRHYPYSNSSITAYNITEKLINNILQPYYRMQGSPALSRMFSKINSIVVNKYHFEGKARAIDKTDKEYDILDKARKLQYKKGMSFNSHDDKLRNDHKYKNIDGNFIHNGDLFGEHAREKINAIRLKNNKQYRHNKITHKEIGRKLHVDEIHSKTQSSSYDSEDSSTSHDTYENMSSANEYLDSMMLSDEIDNKHRTLETNEQDLEDRDIISRENRAMASSGRNEKRFQQENYKVIYKTHPKRYERRYTEKSTRNRKGSYDRLKQNEYNYEKALRYKQLRHRSHEVRSKVKNAKQNNEKSNNKNEMYKVNRNFKKGRFKSSFRKSYQSFNETYEDEDELFEKEILNSKISITQKISNNGHVKLFNPTSSFKVPSTKNHLKDTEKKKKKVNTILEESSYSDEENKLKAILSDVIRHSDFNIKNYRKRFDNTQVFKEKNSVGERSSYSDEEGIFKNNIYKAFGYNADLDLKERIRRVL